MKINKVIAAKVVSLKEWDAVCTELSTPEVGSNGSRLVQGSSRKLASHKRRQLEERFLVKWDGFSFLHCSWETERDLVKYCEGAKGRLTTFRRKATNGLLYSEEERLGGVYFDPSWLTVDRILDVQGKEGDMLL